MKDIVEMVKEMTTRVKTEDSKGNIFVSQFDIITIYKTTTENIFPVHMQYCNLCRIKKKIYKMKTRMSHNLIKLVGFLHGSQITALHILYADLNKISLLQYNE